MFNACTSQNGRRTIIGLVPRWVAAESTRPDNSDVATPIAIAFQLPTKQLYSIVLLFLKESLLIIIMSQARQSIKLINKIK